jgi:hypothetical protein
MSLTLSRVFSRRVFDALVLGWLLSGGIPAATTAAPLVVGVPILAPGQAGPTGGTIVAGPLVENFSTATYSGTLVSEVISGDPSNSLGGLTFVYALTNDATSSDAIERFTINGYSGVTIDASYQAPAVGQIPTLIDRSGDPTVGFSFINPVPAVPGFGQGVLDPGSSSALLVLQTNVSSIVAATANVIDGSVIGVPSVAPSPEPSSLVLATLGFLGLAVWGCRRLSHLS